MMGNMQQGQNPLFGASQQFPSNMQGSPQGNWFGWNPNMGRPQQQQKMPSLWVPVASLEEAKNVFVSPGETKWIMILNAMMFAVKSVNEAGVTDFQAYDFAPHVEQQQAPQQNGSISMDDVMGTMQVVLQKLNGMENELAALKEVKEIEDHC